MDRKTVTQIVGYAGLILAAVATILGFEAGPEQSEIIATLVGLALGALGVSAK